MSENKIPEEVASGWKKDFDLYINDFIGTAIGFDKAVEDYDEALDYVGDYIGLEGVWISAKSSSYEREQNLILRNKKLNTALSNINRSRGHGEHVDAQWIKDEIEMQASSERMAEVKVKYFTKTMRFAIFISLAVGGVIGISLVPDWVWIKNPIYLPLAVSLITFLFFWIELYQRMKK